MKVHILLILSIALHLGGCSSSPSDNNASESTPRTTVTLTRAVRGNILPEIVLSATTVYQNKSVAAAPIPAFITQALVQPGTRVKAGQLLYRLESTEQHALGSGQGTSIPVKAAQDGIVIDVQQQAGSYVAEGTTLCTLADAGSLVFEINVPYEQLQYAQNGKSCTLELPDGSRYRASVQLPLATLNKASQSERVIARAVSLPFLPEGMNLKAIFTESRPESESLILPKSAVQSDETLTEHWVMEMADDSTAVKVPVQVTGSNATSTAVKSDSLSLHDRIILTGGYGLEEGAKVTVTH